MERRELIFMDSASNKFWNIELDGSSHTVTYGRSGTDGQTKTKSFADDEAAKKNFDKLVSAKLKKGYVDTGSASASTGDDGDGIPTLAFRSVVKQDDLYHNAKTFIGKRVADYDPDRKPAAGGKTVYRFRSEWDAPNCIPHLKQFLATDAATEAVGIIIGNWAGEDSDPNEVIKLLCDSSDQLESLKAIYLGDIISEENEMSWIHQADVSPLLEAFPNLELLRTRGGNDLAISKPKHAKLRGLICESGGLPAEVVRAIVRSDFPELEHLELWLGTEEYGGDSSVEDLQPILSGELFPKLKYLGLRNCEFADGIAAVIVNSPLVQRIETLDLSLGVMTDEGGRALLSLPTSGVLQHASLHYNYLTKEVTNLLSKLPINLDLSKPSHMDDDEEWRFVAVGE
ncbi:STM4015 family protein [Allorhodopirellula heiligendammensis]|uniref:WGR domain protein n=1 Tax=Allorhodopirellula heiligendammensis TaxID=2714739 RepID=A0A5C6C150_9BACT|nr:STM4015 family protein [Allorhodopirellula heiligendammensis]TWU17852.1 WGR domain protein [Allorhodopirellula heiligendammensis]